MKIPTRAAALAAGLATAVLLGFGPSQADAGDLKTRMIAANCAVCHGPGGKSAGHTPGLDSETSISIKDALTKFASGDKPSTIMQRISKAFTPEQIQAIANHIAMANGKR